MIIINQFFILAHPFCMASRPQLKKYRISLFYSYLVTPRPILGLCRGSSLTQFMLLLHCTVRPEYLREPRNEVGLLTSVERPVGFESGSF